MSEEKIRNERARLAYSAMTNGNYTEALEIFQDLTQESHSLIIEIVVCKMWLAYDNSELFDPLCFCSDICALLDELRDILDGKSEENEEKLNDICENYRSRLIDLETALEFFFSQKLAILEFREQGEKNAIFQFLEGIEELLFAIGDKLETVPEKLRSSLHLRYWEAGCDAMEKIKEEKPPYRYSSAERDRRKTYVDKIRKYNFAFPAYEPYKDMSREERKEYCYQQKTIYPDSFNSYNDSDCVLGDMLLIPDGIEVIAEKAMLGGISKIKTIGIPKDVKRIEKEAFAGYDYLKEVIFDEGSQLEYIGSNAFKMYGGKYLKKVKIPPNCVCESDAFESKCKVKRMKK